MLDVLIGEEAMKVWGGDIAEHYITDRRADGAEHVTVQSSVCLLSEPQELTFNTN